METITPLYSTSPPHTLGKLVTSCQANKLAEGDVSVCIY